MGELGWGHRYLVCPPRYFEVAYEINPWMHREVRVDPDRAYEQWEAYVGILRDAGAEVVAMDPVEGLPDLVFTANAGVLSGDRVVTANFRNPERVGETPVDEAWFQSAGYEVLRLPEHLRHEGAGDALPFGGVLVSGYRQRSDAAAHATLSKLLGIPVRVVELTDERFYHLDLTFCPLDDRRAIVAPDYWDDYGRRVIEGLVPEPLVLEPAEAEAFTANSVVVGSTILMPAVLPRVGRQLEAWGFTPVEVDVGEFLKAGGACRCLTLALDVDLRGAAN